jgi:hypothetical protein
MFWQKGFDSTSVSDLTAALGLITKEVKRPAARDGFGALKPFPGFSVVVVTRLKCHPMRRERPSSDGPENVQQSEKATPAQRESRPFQAHFLTGTGCRRPHKESIVLECP